MGDEKQTYDIAQHVIEQDDEVKGVAPDFAGGENPTPCSGPDTGIPGATHGSKDVAEHRRKKD